MKITRKSTYSGIERTLDLNVTQQQLDNWQAGMLAQKAFSDLNANDREFIISGITEEEWNKMYPEELEYDEPDSEEEDVF